MWMGGKLGNGLKRPRYAMPTFVRQALEQAELRDAYEGRPPYQRNDYLWWITTAKREKTQRNRLTQMLDELALGDVYMNMPWRPQPQPSRRR